METACNKNKTSSNPAMGYEERCKPQQHEQFCLIWRPGTASGSTFFFLHSNSKIPYDFFQKLRPAGKLKLAFFRRGVFPRGLAGTLSADCRWEDSESG